MLYNSIITQFSSEQETIVYEQIDINIIELLQDKKKDANSHKSSTQMNSNEIEEGTNKKRSSTGEKNNSEDQDEVAITVQRIRYSLKQVYKLADIAWANDFVFDKIQDVVNLENDIVTQVTGLTTEEWSAIMNTINTVSANRALGQYYDYQ